MKQFFLVSVHPTVKIDDRCDTEEETEEATTPPRKRGRPRKGEVVVKPLKRRRRGPQKEEDKYKILSEYDNRPRKTKIERTRQRRATRHHCILCGEDKVTSNIVRHLSVKHCYPLKLRSYILDVTRIRNQQRGKHPKNNDCITRLRRFVATRSHRHHFDYFQLVQVPDFMSLDGLCRKAKAIMSVCDGDLNNAFEKIVFKKFRIQFVVLVWINYFKKFRDQFVFFSKRKLVWGNSKSNVRFLPKKQSPGNSEFILCFFFQNKIISKKFLVQLVVHFYIK